MILLAFCSATSLALGVGLIVGWYAHHDHDVDRHARELVYATREAHDEGFADGVWSTIAVHASDRPFDWGADA